MYANMRIFWERTQCGQPPTSWGTTNIGALRYLFLFFSSSSRNKWVQFFLSLFLSLYLLIICSFIFKLVLSLSISHLFIQYNVRTWTKKMKWNDWNKDQINHHPRQICNGEKEKTTSSLTYKHWNGENAARAIIFTLGVYCSRFLFLLSFSIYAPLMCLASVLHVERSATPTTKQNLQIIVVNILYFIEFDK